MTKTQAPARTTSILVKLRPTTSVALAASESRANLRPLYATPPGRSRARESAGARPAMAVSAGESQWFLADLSAGDAATPWDLAHSRIAAELGVDESAVEFAEPDLVQPELPDEDLAASPGGHDCTPKPQNDANGQVKGPENGWHLGDDYSQLAKARDAVAFSDPRTRIAHVDTGYYAKHVSRPKHLRTDLQRNFVDKDHDPSNAEDPDNDAFLLDNSGHGTGTLGILAGGAIPDLGNLVLGGAPEADVVPLRVADRVVLWKTSAFARALNYAVDKQCDVVSMSMGGVPSRAWREAVDRAYLEGVCVVTAAGNNFGGLPTRHIVYPARFGRVIAACGVMANGASYSHLQNRTMEGNYGPDKIMKHALSGYTPNIPWALYGCPDRLRQNGGGTSSATPQIAAAAALWLEKYKGELPRDWRRVEAVRNALFESARSTDTKKLGRGALRAAKALAIQPDLTLPQTKSDSAWLGFLRILTGLGVTEPTPREEMFNLEIAQRLLLSPALQEIAPDPDAAALTPAALERFMEALVEDEATSDALRTHVKSRFAVLTRRTLETRRPRRRGRRGARRATGVGAPAFDRVLEPERPPYRRLRIYSLDPSYATQLATAPINEVTLQIRWEDLARGPKGEYIEVVDTDPSGKTYPAVDLDAPFLLASDGFSPSEGNPQFHQQMVYAVAMKTIEHFEAALGRPVLWRHALNPRRPLDDSGYVGRLSVNPHALRQANAFYSQSAIALHFGYFEIDATDRGGGVPGSRVYTCLSTDIIAHETTHAILDGMHRRFNEPTNPDVLAFHEAFADIVALMQHFTLREVVEHEMKKTRGDLEAESMLGSLAVQFGRATNGRSALRDAIGRIENGAWKRNVPDPGDMQTRLTPHARGAILVAAVFDAFLAIYRARSEDLIRLNTAGSGVLPSGAIHPDLVQRLTDEATKSARHVLTMCLRALDYLPPVDVTFFEYLRALITADHDLVADDRHNYRVAFAEAFRRRGIFPVPSDDPADVSLRNLSVDTLRWRGVDEPARTLRGGRGVLAHYDSFVRRLQRFADLCLYIDDRRELFERTRAERRELQRALAKALEDQPAFAAVLGLEPKLESFEVHQLRPARRVSPDGKTVPQVILGLTQTKRLDAGKRYDAPGNLFRGGSTLVIDLTVPSVKYRIVKRVTSASRLARTQRFVEANTSDPLRALLLAPEREPFAVLHALES